MTIADWLAARQPAAPPRLRQRVEQVLASDLAAASAEMPMRAARAAERLLSEVLGQEGRGRDAALDLLTVDALVTYAFEAAAAGRDAATVDALARETMQRVAALASPATNPA